MATNKDEALIQRYEQRQIDTITHQRKEIEVLLEGLDRMRSYVESPKFRDDVYVNKSDILLFISEIKQSVFEVNQ